MRFDDSDKKFIVKVSLLFTVLVIGVFLQKTQPSLRNVEQDVINTESKYPDKLKSFTVKKSSISTLY